MFNTVIGVLALRAAPLGNQVLITGPINSISMLGIATPPIQLSSAAFDIVGSTVAPPISISSFSGDITASTAFVFPIHISNQAGT